MMGIHTFSLALTLCFIAGCGGSGGGDGSIDTDSPLEGSSPLSLNFTEPPIELFDAAADYASDVAYGDGPLERFDIFLPKCNGPTPLIIFIHGYGFVGGDKNNAYEDSEIIRKILRSCIAYATVNYVLLNIPSTDEEMDSIIGQGGLLTSLRGIARSLQFMRYHHESLNLEPEDVALYGISAGGGASLWLGTHDDLANPLSKDPVFHESTRVKAVGAISTQSTYDVLRWESILSPIATRLATMISGHDVPSVAKALGKESYLLTAMGIARVEDLYTSENEVYRSSIDMLELMDAGDAPIFANNYDNGGFDDPFNLILHHGLHALALKERADEVGLESVIYAEDREFRYEDPSGEDLVSFLTRHIQ